MKFVKLFLIMMSFHAMVWCSQDDAKSYRYTIDDKASSEESDNRYKVRWEFGAGLTTSEIIQKFADANPDVLA